METKKQSISPLFTLNLQNTQLKSKLIKILQNSEINIRSKKNVSIMLTSNQYELQYEIKKNKDNIISIPNISVYKVIDIISSI